MTRRERFIGRVGCRMRAICFARAGRFSRVGRGTLAAREILPTALFCDTSPAAIPYVLEDLPVIGFWLNTRILSYLLRAMTQSLDCREGYVQRLPIPEAMSAGEANDLNQLSLRLRQNIVAETITDYTYSSRLGKDSGTFGAALLTKEALYLTNEAMREATAFKALDLGYEDIQLVADDVGAPAGFLPLLAGFDSLPVEGQALVPEALSEYFSSIPRITLGATVIADIKQKLKNRIEDTECTLATAEDPPELEDSEEDVESEVEGPSGIPIPPETALERLCSLVNLHPVSVLGLIDQMSREEGLINAAKLRTDCENDFSELILRLFGHQWPTEIESGSPLPGWVEKEGIIPISEIPHRATSASPRY